MKGPEKSHKQQLQFYIDSLEGENREGEMETKYDPEI
jgi:hypothetical protein